MDRIEQTLYSQALELAVSRALSSRKGEITIDEHQARDESTKSFVANFMREHNHTPSSEDHQLCMEASTHIYGGEQLRGIPYEMIRILLTLICYSAGSDTV